MLLLRAAEILRETHAELTLISEIEAYFRSRNKPVSYLEFDEDRRNWRGGLKDENKPRED